MQTRENASDFVLVSPFEQPRVAGPRTLFRAPMLGPGIVFFGLFAAACARTPERLPERDRQFYYNLSTESEREQFLRIRASQRQDFLIKSGLWEQWLALSPEEKKGVENKSVRVGFSEFAAHLAWGPPADVRIVGENTRRPIRYETFIYCTSGPKRGRYVRQNIDCDGTSSEVQLAIDDGKVAELKYLE